MNRPTNLINDLKEFNEVEYGNELSSKQCHEIAEYIDKLEKTVDKATELLSDIHDCQMVGDLYYHECPFREECKKGEHQNCIATDEKWKEYLFKR